MMYSENDPDSGIPLHQSKNENDPNDLSIVDIRVLEVIALEAIRQTKILKMTDTANIYKLLYLLRIDSPLFETKPYPGYEQTESTRPVGALIPLIGEARIEYIVQMHGIWNVSHALLCDKRELYLLVNVISFHIGALLPLRRTLRPGEELDPFDLVYLSTPENLLWETPAMVTLLESHYITLSSLVYENPYLFALNTQERELAELRDPDPQHIYRHSWIKTSTIDQRVWDTEDALKAARDRYPLPPSYYLDQAIAARKEKINGLNTPKHKAEE